MPVVKHDDSPNSHASVIGWIQFGGLRCIVGHTHGVIAVEHTSIPARRNRVIKRDVGVGVRSGRAVMHQRVGLERDQRVDVVGGGDADRLGQPADFADVAADFLRVADADADQFELRMFDDLGDHHLADETGTPHHNPFSHAPPSDRQPPVHPRRLRSAFGRNRKVIRSIIRSRNVNVCSSTAEMCAAIAAINA